MYIILDARTGVPRKGLVVVIVMRVGMDSIP
jgi:hypothetical protein